MCGLVGAFAVRGLPSGYPLEAMRDQLAHRGPDGRGTWWRADRRVALGHCRLAVIDLSPAGRQPMRSTSGRTVVIFNGEIYNHHDLRAELEARGSRFHSASDTEVILEGYEAWGEAVLTRLQGMFAFALVDEPNGRLLLARDRVGEKPLFIGRFGGRLVFGSELKALLSDPDAPRAIDRAALAFYLAYGYVPGARCLLRGFEKLPPASALSVDLHSGAERSWRYWTPEGEGKVPATGHGPATALLDEFASLLEAAVARQLVADVPVGVLLSGGLDSSLVAAMAVRRASSRVRTFTVTFPGHAGHDEGPHARLVAAHLGTEHIELHAEETAVDLLPAIVRQVDEPIGDSAVVPTWLVARLIRRQATVALGGDGSDELFGGYPHYQWLIRLAAARAWPAPLRRVVSRAAVHLPPGVRGRHHLIGLAGDVAQSMAHVNLYFDAATRCALVPAAAAAAALPEQWRATLGHGREDVRDRAMLADLRSTLPDGYLARVDRASMHCALEVRAPFLDVPLLEFAVRRVPVDLKVTRTARKILPARLAERVLPPAFDRARKQGFTMPLQAWFARGWGDLVADVLHADTELFSRPAVDRLLAGQRAGRANVERLFALAMLALWRREYRVSL